MNEFPQHFNSAGPLAFFNVFFGEPNQDPKTNPKVPFSDADFQNPLTAKQTLDADGAYAQDIFLNGFYSIRIETSLGSLFRESSSISGLSALLVQFFNTVADMVAATSLKVGDLVTTYGYTTIGDSGDNTYEVVAAGTGTDDGGSFIDLDTLQAKALFTGGLINFEKFGAIGDGATDDITALTNCVAYANTNTLQIQAEAAKYLMTGGITFSAKTSMIGKGFSENSGNSSVTEFLKKSTFSGTLIKVTSAAVKLANFAVEGEPGNGGDGIGIESNTAVLEDISCHNQGNDGIRFGSNTPGVNVNKFQARNIICHSNGRHGVNIDQDDGIGSSDANGGSIIGLNVFNNGDEGLSLNQCAANSIVGIVAQINVSFGVGVHAGASQNIFFGGDINEGNDTGGGGPFDLQVDAAAEQNAFYWVAMNQTKINVLDPETFIQSEDRTGFKNEYTDFNTAGTTTNLIPFDDSIPQITEGAQFLSQSITRGWGTCGYLIDVVVWVSSSVAANISMALFDGDTDALASAGVTQTAADDMVSLSLTHKVVVAPSGITTYTVRIGADTAGTLTFAGISGVRIHGGVLSSSISIKQVE